MQHRWFSILTLFSLMGVLLILPISALAETSPSGGVNPVIEKERLQFRTDVAQWQAQGFLEFQDIFQQGWQQVAAALTPLGGSIRVPDLSGQIPQIKGLAEAVASASNDKQSTAALEQLQAYIKNSRKDNQARAEDMQKQVDAVMVPLQEKVKKQVDEFVNQLKDKSKAEIQAQVEEYRKSIIPAGINLTPAQQTAISQQVQQYAKNIGSQKQAANKVVVEAKVKEITQPTSGKVTKLGEAFNDLGAKMQAHFTKVQGEARTFDERRRVLILKMADANVSAVRENWGKLSKEQQDKLGIKNLDAELASARSQLEKDLAAALSLSSVTPPVTLAKPKATTTKPQGPAKPQPPPKPPAPANMAAVKDAIQQAVQTFSARWQDIAKKTNQK
ncbi:MAG: hypothetical protein HY670_08980 [Chloroflexi bacterium]|nr:hypothetical protein [Chloroflexota bacterium]